MKIKAALVLSSSVICLVAGARITYELSVKGAIAKVNLKVVDQDGVAVPDAKIWGAFTANHLKDSVLVDGMTNTNGEFVAQGNCNEFLRVDVTKEGYYHTEAKINFRRSKSDPIVVDGKWQPYGETRTVVLNRIKDPLSVKVFDENSHRRRIPLFGAWIGFDLEIGDWLPPHGNGKFEDVCLRFKSDVRKRRIDYTYVMDVSFTNNPHAGAYIAKKDTASDLKTEYAADTNANYQSTFSFATESVSGRPVKANYLDQDSYLVFRTRTKVDESGRLIGAHYGKICGVWRSSQDKMHISDGCFNSFENDTNIEGDQTLRDAIRNYNDTNKDAWLHSDMKDMGYFYVYKLYEQIIQKDI